ncbi:MAG: hypothetical protein WA071_14835 [Undibacterium umbellatum]|uniref:hypothetical protein n=1 Tax=Undibacterium umbellatum TaxID=2762300 RepID=UPI003BB68E4D
MSENSKSRITVQIATSIACEIQNQFSKLHINRDAFLNDLLTQEIELLETEMTFRNSDEVYKSMSQRKLIHKTKLTITLDISLIERINQVLEEKKVVRDSFFNRILFFLIATPSLLEKLMLNPPNQTVNASNPMEGAKTFLTNPFNEIRNRNKGLFYTLTCFPDRAIAPQGQNLFLLNTAIDSEAAAKFGISINTVEDEKKLFSSNSEQQLHQNRQATTMAELASGKYKP